jgi:hypothetical protein
MATGVKCLPCTSLYDEEGDKFLFYHDLIRDSHAEVLAKRALIRYLLFNRDKIETEVWLFTSCVPCGDASITTIPDQETFEEYGFERGKQDWNKLGYLRTKPARADAPITHSMSCSDKILLWRHLGVQGKFLPYRISLKGIIAFGSNIDGNSMERAFKRRFKVDQVREDDFLIVEKNLAPIYDVTLQSSPIAQVWHREIKMAETIVLGKKQGSFSLVTKKTRSLFCDFSLLELSNGYHNENFLTEKEKFFEESKIFSHWPFHKRKNNIHRLHKVYLGHYNNMKSALS